VVDLAGGYDIVVPLESERFVDDLPCAFKVTDSRQKEMRKLNDRLC